MRWMMGVLLSLIGASLAWADVLIVYRKVDRLVVGTVTPPQTIAQELTNITASELGGTSEDYAVTSVPALPRHQRPVVQVDGSVSFEDPPVNVEQQQAEARIRAKLGLTPKEFDDLREAVR